MVSPTTSTSEATADPAADPGLGGAATAVPSRVDRRAKTKAAAKRRAKRSVRRERAKGKRRFLLYLRDLILGLMVLAIFALAAGSYYLERFEILSGSMEPTLEVGERVWGVRRMQAPERGGLIAFRNPWGDEMVIKRIIAMPGEMVEARDGTIFINLGEIDESVWVDDPEPTSSFELVALGPDEYFVMGDNRDRSTDSRDFGPISLEAIEYRILGFDDKPTQVSSP